MWYKRFFINDMSEIESHIIKEHHEFIELLIKSVYQSYKKKILILKENEV